MQFNFNGGGNNANAAPIKFNLNGNNQPPAGT